MIHNCDKEECLCNRPDVSHEDLVNFITSHKQDVLSILKTNEFTDEIQNKLVALTEQLEKEKTENEKLQKCLEIKEKETSGSHSMYKGEYRELYQEIVAGRLYGDTYEVDGKKKMKCMDIRLKHKTLGFTVGLETKEKKSLTPLDISKFHEDRLNNSFQAGIMVSTQAPVKGFVVDVNTFKMTDNELYIYSNDANFIGIIIGCFLTVTEQKFIRECAACESSDKIYDDMKAKLDRSVDYVKTLYSKWQTCQKANFDFDKQLLISLKELNVSVDLFKGHRYIVSRSKCKGNKHPYGLESK